MVIDKSLFLFETKERDEITAEHREYSWRALSDLKTRHSRGEQER
jgi:hypothetical protein